MATIRKNYERSVSRGSLKPEQLEERIKLISPTLDYAALASADLIIEAVFENMALKKEIFAKLDAVAKPGAILGTNTSTLDIDEIAAVTRRPQDVIGLHFFSPANVMQLLEIVQAGKTAPGRRGHRAGASPSGSRRPASSPRSATASSATA